MTPAAPVVVNLLTGFLGAGKTTLLKRLLAHPEFARSAVLINEFGEVGLDHLLLERLDDDVVLLKSGCVCCTIRGDLKEALTSLHARRARGETPAFDRLVIETTGLADPAPIVATLVADPALRHHYRLGAVVAVVDGVSGAATLGRHDESVRQAAAADRIVVSKADLAAPENIAALTAALAKLNPLAEVLTLDDATAAPVRLFDEAPPRSPAAAPADLHEHPHSHSHHHRHLDLNRHGDVNAFTLTADEPLDWARFGLWLSMLLHRHGANVLRLKGLLNVEGAATPAVIQGVQHLIHPPVHLARWPGGRPRTELVVIARGVDPATVERSFRAFNRIDREVCRLR